MISSPISMSLKYVVNVIVLDNFSLFIYYLTNNIFLHNFLPDSY